jgi:hypothetical protein
MPASANASSPIPHPAHLPGLPRWRCAPQKVVKTQWRGRPRLRWRATLADTAQVISTCRWVFDPVLASAVRQDRLAHYQMPGIRR